MKNTKLILGIDPAFREKGFGACFIEDREVTFKIFKDVSHFVSWFMFERPLDCISAIENSNLQNVTFNMSGNKNVVAKMSRSVGKNQAISQMTYDLFLSVYGKDKVYNISPARKGAKWLRDETAFKAMRELGLTTKKKKLNQDFRDALKLALMIYKR